MRTKEAIIQFEFGFKHSVERFLLRKEARNIMEEWAKEFADWLSHNTSIIYENKIVLYRYTDKNNEVGNYTLEDIYYVFDEESKSI